MKSGSEVTELLKVCGNFFAVTRYGERVRIRKLATPKARALPACAVVVRLKVGG
ncbi:hypothetical protein ACFQZQ_03100 [Lysobacter koreensis]|uniref:Uncharacterized protein n=1 Tax=Lysobacter koreensis TaxID=266122 RepID=A0ABW2YJA2_9GAMM